MNELAARAETAARAARLLLDQGDYVGAVSRAYYAMFDLARAQLRDIDPKLAAAKTHTSIIARFSKHLVQERGLPREIGRTLDAHSTRDFWRSIPTPPSLSSRPKKRSKPWSGSLRLCSEEKVRLQAMGDRHDPKAAQPPPPDAGRRVLMRHAGHCAQAAGAWREDKTGSARSGETNP